MSYEDIKSKCINEVYKAEKDCVVLVKQKANTSLCSINSATYSNIDKVETFALNKGDSLYSSEKEIKILKVINIGD